MVLIHEKHLVWFLYTNTFHGTTVICLFAKHNIIWRYIWGPIHHDASHGMPVETSGASASILTSSGTPLGPVSTLGELTLWFVGLHMSELSIRYCNLFLFCVMTTEKWHFCTVILKFFGENFLTLPPC